MYALERGLHMKWLALLFAFFGGFASFGIGCATQVNAIATVCNENLSISPVFIGIAVAALTALVIFGGINQSQPYVNAWFRSWLSFMYLDV